MYGGGGWIKILPRLVNFVNTLLHCVCTLLIKHKSSFSLSLFLWIILIPLQHKKVSIFFHHITSFFPSFLYLAILFYSAVAATRLHTFSLSFSLSHKHTHIHTHIRVVRLYRLIFSLCWSLSISHECKHIYNETILLINGFFKSFCSIFFMSCIGNWFNLLNMPHNSSCFSYSSI